MVDYQTLSKYSGTLYGEPKYNGIEYDWEVPDNVVIGSPGGVSTIHHHYTKGFDGRGNTSSDIYAGQGEIYNSGEYGNLYNTGHTASQVQGYYPAAPDYQYWQNQEPQQYTYYNSEAAMRAPFMKEYGNPGSFMSDPKKKSFGTENFSHPVSSDEEYTLIDDISPIVQNVRNEIKGDVSDIVQDVVHKSLPSTYALLFIGVIVFIMFVLWSNSINSLAAKYLFKTDKMNMKQTLILTAVITAIVIFVVWAYHSQ